MSRIEKFAAWCDTLIAFSFYGLIYFLPISIALTEILSGLAILLYFIKRGAIFFSDIKNGSAKWSSFFAYFKPLSNYLNKPLAIWLIVSFITVIISQYPRASIEGFVGKTLQGVFTYFALIEGISTPKRIKTSLVIFTISFLLISINGLYQYFVGHCFIHGHVFDGRISSSFRQANDFAAYLVVTTLILFCHALLPNKTEKPHIGSVSFALRGGRLILFVLFVLSFVCLILTYSRGAWIAFVLCLLILWFRNWKVSLFSLVFIGIFAFVFYNQSIRTVPSDNQWKTYFLTENNRLGYWARSVSIIKDYPVFGSGLNTYSSIQWRYDVGWGGYPHNSYLQIAAETGLAGLSAFLWMIIILLKNSFRNLKQISDLFIRLLLLSFLAGLVGFLIHSFFDTNLYSVQLGSFMWLLIGIIVAVQKIDKATKISQ